MKERLVIKNFGPIKSVDLELGKMTILIGEQATGKSTIAKVLAVCRYFSYIVDFRISGELGKISSFQEGLQYWEIDSYFNNDSYIEYYNQDYKVIINNGEESSIDKTFNLTISRETIITTIFPKSEKFKNLLEDLEKLKQRERLKIQEDKVNFKIANVLWRWMPDENFFRLNVKKVMNNPFYIPTERGLQTLFTLGRNVNNLSDSLLDQLNKLNKITRSFQKKITINSLQIDYKNENGAGFTKKQFENNFYTLHNGASGFKSVVPIELSVNYYTNIENRNKTFIIEEPELNLFPKAQKKLMEFFVENINNNEHSFLLPTHSPYILSSIENLMYAYKLGNIENGIHKDKVKLIVPESYWINPDYVSVYYLNNGEEKDILDRREALIDKEYIDSVSKIINDEFDQLLNIEVEYEH